MTRFSAVAIRTLSVALALLVLLAAAGKIDDPRDVAKSIAFLLSKTIDPSGLPILLAYIVIATEIFISFLLILTRPSPKLFFAVFAMLLIFTLALLLLARDPSAPDCGCFSILQFATEESRSARLGILRNSLLLIATGWLFWASIRQPPEEVTADGPTTPAQSRRASGFTIIEVVITTAVAAVLLSLVLPSLQGARLRAEMTWSLSTHRQVLASVFIYTIDYDDTLPSLGVQGRIGPGLVHHDGVVLGRDYFQTHLFYWSSLIYPAYFNNLDALEHDGLPHESHTQDVLGLKNEVRSIFLMSYNAWADPRLWNEQSPKPAIRLLRATKTGEILFPSEKGLLLDIAHGALNQEKFPGYRNMPVGKADGSAGELDLWSVQESAVYSHPDWPVSWPLPVLATRDGLAGRDF